MRKPELDFKIRKLLLVASVCLLFIPISSSAATLYFDPANQEINLNEQFGVNFFLNTENEKINAIEGDLVFPEGLLELKEIRDGNSIINFWVERPKIKSNNQIAFSGIIPGGYIGRKGLIFSAIFQPKDQGEGVITVQGARALLNDGEGSEASAIASNFRFVVSKEALSSQELLAEIVDVDPPEVFEPVISQNPEIFGGKYFLVFLTQDKGSGIDHYEILEKERKNSIRRLIKKSNWQVGESPYLLRDQELKSYIFVKAIDKAGNERVAVLPPQNPLKWYENFFIWLMVFITVVIVYIIWRRIKRSDFNRLSLLSIALLIAAGLVLPIPVFAASLSISPATGSYNVGETFSVGVYVSSVDQAMNAASGVISFPPDKLEVISLSKSGSIITLWVQEPIFSNKTGTINFEGVVLNPGFTGSAGKIVTIKFRTKAVGSAPVTFSSASVLANDGKGTNILAKMSSGNYVIQPKKIVPSVPPVEEYTPPRNTPAAPIISSPTHPNPEKWYSNSNPKFSWEIPKDITGVRLLVGHKPIAIPTVFYSKPITEKQLEDLADGIWYFHVQLRNKAGWGGIAHFKFQIDTQPPKPFGVKIKEGRETTNPQPTLLFEAIDEMSGIEYYEVKIGEWESGQLAAEDLKDKPFQMPVSPPGEYTILVKAVDKAGNYTLAMTEVTILPIETPVITDYSQTMLPGSILSIKGTALPGVQVRVYTQKDKEEVKIEEIKSDEKGKWSYIRTEPLEEGVYKVWVEAVDSLGATSRPSEKITIQVSPPVFIKIGNLAIDYLTTIITLLVLILTIVLGLIWTWRKFIKREKRLKREVTEAEKALYYAFKALKEETKEQIAKLDGKPGLSEREKKICNELKKALKVSEKFIGKEIKDIEELLEK